MILLNELGVYNFKNHESRSWVFSKPIIGITGKNGCGKTNILDAIHFLCFTKSYFVHQDALTVTHGKSGMRIDGTFKGDDEILQVVYILRENGRKEFSINNEVYSQLSRHIGRLPCVFISPDDTELISEGSEMRRRYLDMNISQTDQNYMQYLIKYNRVLQQRNSLLKRWNEIGIHEQSILDIYDTQLSELANAIYTKRAEAVKVLFNEVQRIYNLLSGGNEMIELTYRSSLHNESLKDSLQQGLQRDIITQRTNYGIHKDDLLFHLNGMPLKQAASQGQRKSFLFGLKLAAFEWIVSQNRQRPILLLDDIFEKLDEERGRNLIEYINTLDTQIFITDTHFERLEMAFSDLAGKFELISL